MQRRHLLVLGALLCACRKGTENQTGSFVPIAAAPAGTQGCGALAPAPTGTTELTLAAGTQAVIGPLSRMAGVPGTQTAYLTGADGSVHLLDLSVSPVGDATLVNAGTIEALLALAPSSAVLSGIAILDLGTLVVAEHTSNTLIDVSRATADDVALFAGTPSTTGGFADGTGGAIFFRFDAPVDLLAATPRTVYVTDTGNHAIRRVDRASRVGLASAITIAGSGAPGFADGDLTSASFDTPSGLSLTCPGEMIVTESGAAGFGGNRLRLLRVGSNSFFGLQGSTSTLAGDGSAVSVEGVDTLAALAAPVSPVLGADASSSTITWIDSGTGALRRHDLATGLSDCPLDPVTCGASFPAGAGYSLIRGGDDALYVLAADTARLFRVDP